MEKVAFIGSGDLALHIANYLDEVPNFTIIGFYDDFKKSGDNVPFGKILGPLSHIKQDFNSKVFDSLIIAIGYNHLQLRKEIFNNLSNLIPFTTFIHSSCMVANSCSIGAGVIALPGCIFDTNVIIENNVFFNIGCNIAHDCIIESHSFFGPSVSLAGFVKVEQACFIGINTTIINNVTICPGTTTGAGSVITKSLTQSGLYAGVPAKLLKSI